MDVRVPEWLGVAAIIGGALLVVAELVNLPYMFTDDFAAAAQEPLYQFGSYLFLIGVVFISMGIAAMYAVHDRTFGRFGRVVTVLAFVFTVLMAGAAWSFAFVEPTLAIEAPALLENESPAGPVMIGFMVTFIGVSLAWLLLGIAVFRAGVLSKAASVLVMIGAVVAALPFPTVGVGVLIGVGFAWWGMGASRLLAGGKPRWMAMPRMRPRPPQEAGA